MGLILSGTIGVPCSGPSGSLLSGGSGKRAFLSPGVVNNGMGKEARTPDFRCGLWSLACLRGPFRPALNSVSQTNRLGIIFLLLSLKTELGRRVGGEGK